ncbi:MAG: adenosylcobinamide-GDP ribazoletransferase [Frankiaceae bacterium]|nr:adenosylcobinamide-GDP ribazoletransferase [Frankiaceae bacterium]
MTGIPEYGGLRLAFTTLTALPMRAGRLDRQTAGRAMAWSPVVGVVVGALASAGIVVMRYASPESGVQRLLPVGVGIGLLALLTRGLHLDGLADTVDGLGVTGRERALDVMRQSDIGTFGVLALVLVVLLQASALTTADIAQHGTRSLICAVATGRIAITWACARDVPAARPSGLGALVAGTLPRMVPLAWSVFAVVAGSGWAYLDDRGRLPQALIQGLAIAVALIVARIVQARLVRRLGGITGDVLGALCEIATTVALVLAASLPGSAWFHRH